MSKLDVIVYADGADTTVNPYAYATAKDFAASVVNAEAIYLGKDAAYEIPGDLPEVAWYAATYARTYDIDIVMVLFTEYGFLRGKNLTEMPGFDTVLDGTVLYSPSEQDAVATAYMAYRNVDAIAQQAVDRDKLFSLLIADRDHDRVRGHDVYVVWHAGDPALTEGWGRP